MCPADDLTCEVRELRSEVSGLRDSVEQVGGETGSLEEHLSAIATQLDEMASASNGSWLNDFVGTLFATLLGAVLAGGLALLIFRSEKTERYETGLVDHVERLSEAMLTWASAHAKYLAEPVFNGIARQVPDRSRLDIALNALIARTREEDRVVAEQLRSVVYEQSYVRDPAWAGPECAAVQRVANAWCARTSTVEQTSAALRVLYERLSNKQASPSTPRADIRPTAPMQYRRAAGLDPQIDRVIPAAAD